jgi:hypothetical protein
LWPGWLWTNGECRIAETAASAVYATTPRVLGRLSSARLPFWIRRVKIEKYVGDPWIMPMHQLGLSLYGPIVCTLFL